MKTLEEIVEQSIKVMQETMDKLKEEDKIEKMPLWKRKRIRESLVDIGLQHYTLSGCLTRYRNQKENV